MCVLVSCGEMCKQNGRPVADRKRGLQPTGASAWRWGKAHGRRGGVLVVPLFTARGAGFLTGTKRFEGNDEQCGARVCPSRAWRAARRAAWRRR